MPCASRGKRTAQHLHPLTLRPRTCTICTVCTVCTSRLYHLLSLLRDYLVKPLLGAIWKQPLRPHHALDLEPDWVARLAEEEEALKEAVRERMRLRYRYEAGLIPDVAAHCTNMIAELQQARARQACACACVHMHKRLAHAALNRLQAADFSAHELGDLLSEIRQADLKLQEMRLAQRAECRKGDTPDLVERYGKYLQQFGYDLEIALISLERFTAEAGAPPSPAAVAPAATPAATNTSSAGSANDGKVAPPKRSHSTRSMTRSITRSITRSGLRSEPVPREALPQGSRFRRAAHTGPVHTVHSA